MNPDHARKIGLRFVETCATCVHGAGHCKKHGDDVRAAVLTVCNDYAQDMPVITRLMRGLDSPGMPVVSTPPMQWVTCPACKWSGWSDGLAVHVLSAGGEQIVDQCCPSCQGEVKL